MGLKNLSRSAGQRAGKVAAGIAATTASSIGIAQVAYANPWTTTAAVVGIGSIVNYDSPTSQGIAAGPASVRSWPGGGSTDPYDMGASGDLLFALHRSR